MKKQNFNIVRLQGNAYFGVNDYFKFNPSEPKAGRVKCRRRRGYSDQTSDGSFEFVAQPSLRSQAKLIKKLAHGRVSKTKDEAIQLTLKVFCDENINISEAIHEEAMEAVEAIRHYQLRH